MKIIVNATPLQNLPTGIGRYLQSLYKEMAIQHPEAEIRYFDGIGLSKKMPSSPGAESFWAKAVQVAWNMPAIFPYALRTLRHTFQARRFLKLSQGFNVYHEAGYFPFRAAKNVKTVFTIHDISLKILPDFHPKERVRFFNRHFIKSLRQVDAIITPSEFTKNEVAKIYPELKIPLYHVPLGYDPKLFYPQKTHEIKACRNKFQIPEKYIFFVGTSDPRKKIETIVRSLNFLPASVKLVCTGWIGWDKSSRQKAEVLKDRVISTGYISDKDLACLYSGALAFLYPSVYEGFGLPALEAMACGCPVVCTKCASLPEVAGEAAIFCESNNPEEFAKSVQKILDNEKFQRELRFKSLARAGRFSWKQAAKEAYGIFTA